MLIALEALERRFRVYKKVLTNDRYFVIIILQVETTHRNEVYMDKRKIRLDDMFSIYCETFNLYDKHGLSKVVTGCYRQKTGGKVYYLKKANSFKPHYYVVGTWQTVRNYMYDKVKYHKGLTD